MKKWMVGMLALLLLALSACSVAKAPVVEHTDGVVSEQSAEATAAPEPTAEPEKKFSRGKWDGNTFESEFAELKFTIPSQGWIVSSDEELVETMQISMDEMDMSLTEEAMVNLLNITDMMVQNPTTGANAILMYENLEKNPGAKDITVEEYVQIVADGLKEVENIEYTIGEPAARTLCGNEYQMLPVRVEEYDLHQAYLIRSKSGMMVNVILTAVGEAGIDELLAMFAD